MTYKPFLYTALLLPALAAPSLAPTAADVADAVGLPGIARSLDSVGVAQAANIKAGRTRVKRRPNGLYKSVVVTQDDGGEAIDSVDVDLSYTDAGGNAVDVPTTTITSPKKVRAAYDWPAPTGYAGGSLTVAVDGFDPTDVVVDPAATVDFALPNTNIDATARITAKGNVRVVFIGAPADMGAFSGAAPAVTVAGEATELKHVREIWKKNISGLAADALDGIVTFMDTTARDTTGAIVDRTIVTETASDEGLEIAGIEKVRVSKSGGNVRVRATVLHDELVDSTATIEVTDAATGAPLLDAVSAAPTVAQRTFETYVEFVDPQNAIDQRYLASLQPLDAEGQPVGDVVSGFVVTYEEGTPFAANANFSSLAWDAAAYIGVTEEADYLFATEFTLTGPLIGDVASLEVTLTPEDGGSDAEEETAVFPFTSEWVQWDLTGDAGTGSGDFIVDVTLEDGAAMLDRNLAYADGLPSTTYKRTTPPCTFRKTGDLCILSGRALPAPSPVQIEDSVLELTVEGDGLVTTTLRGDAESEVPEFMIIGEGVGVGPVPFTDIVTARALYAGMPMGNGLEIAGFAEVFDFTNALIETSPVGSPEITVIIDPRGNSLDVVIEGTPSALEAAGITPGADIVTVNGLSLPYAGFDRLWTASVPELNGDYVGQDLDLIVTVPQDGVMIAESQTYAAFGVTAIVEDVVVLDEAGFLTVAATVFSDSFALETVTATARREGADYLYASSFGPNAVERLFTNAITDLQESGVASVTTTLMDGSGATIGVFAKDVQIDGGWQEVSTGGLVLAVQITRDAGSAGTGEVEVSLVGEDISVSTVGEVMNVKGVSINVSQDETVQDLALGFDGDKRGYNLRSTTQTVFGVLQQGALDIEVTVDQGAGPVVSGGSAGQTPATIQGKKRCCGAKKMKGKTKFDRKMNNSFENP